MRELQQQQQNQSIDNSGNSDATAVGIGEGGSIEDGAVRVNVEVEGDTVIYRQRRIPVSPSAPVQLVASNDTCMGSAGGSGSTSVISLAFSKTYVDKNCVMLKNSREMWNMGFTGAALARMCADKDNRKAFEQGGIDCPDPNNKETWFAAGTDTTTVTREPVQSGETPVTGNYQ